MKVASVPELRLPTPGQIDQRVEDKVAEHEKRRLDNLRVQLRGEAAAELTAELNRGRLDALITEGARARGVTFLRDVWPDHPAAGHLVSEAIGAESGVRPCGVRTPFRLDERGVMFCDYWVASPIFPAGRLPEGAPVLAFLVDGAWREAVLGVGQQATSGRYGFDVLRGFGLQMNPEPLRGAPEMPATVIGDPGDQMAAAGRVRTAEDLLWRFVNATANECPAELPA